MERYGAAATAVGDPRVPASALIGVAGAALLEVLTAVILVTTLSAMVCSLAHAVFLNARVQQAQSEVVESAVLAIDVIARELRMGGYNAAGSSVLAVREAEPTRVVVASDFNGDGDVTDANETVVYTYDAAGRQVLRGTGGGSPQPFVAGVAPGDFRIAYRDAAGNPVGTVYPLSNDERRRVRRLDVALAVEAPGPTGASASPIRFATGATVLLRNLEDANE